MYTYQVNEDFKVNLYDPQGVLIDWPGPWGNHEEAEQWASSIVEALNNGSMVWPPVSDEAP